MKLTPMQPISLATIADLARHGYSLSAYCWRCRRWHDVDLEEWCREGRGEHDIVALRFRCVMCGEEAAKQVRPPDVGTVARHTENRSRGYAAEA